jgi:NADPH-dependent 2,4-dienoyl-CoA reductase/sulfur reductase-like enzyme
VDRSKTRVVIAGARRARGHAAEVLPAGGQLGLMILVGEEAHPPYERPQLSKSILLDREPYPTFIRAPDSNIQIVGHPPGGGDEIIRETSPNSVDAARDMSVLRRLIASRKTVHRTELKNPDFELKRSLAS